jgi:2-polyprenyl-6-methoxyphenol hydroxylase-like FAD-dependent oxidoreductase
MTAQRESAHCETAVVVGGSIGGLLAARVLSERCTTVTLVERDVLPEDAAQRRGVPQGRHAHGLLSRGREVLEELFPGLTDELLGRGVPARDLQSGFRWVNAGHLLRPAPSGLLGLGVSRPLLEATVRGRVRALPNVEFREGTDATGLTATPDGGRVTGLRVLARDRDGGEQVLPADLVVDASGRGTRGPQWLATLGYPGPVVEQLPIGLAYASRSYRRDADGPDGAAVAGTAAVPRGGVMIAQEDDRWIVSFGGILGDAPPLDDAGYTAFAATLPSPVIHEVIREAEPLSDPVRFRFPASTRRRYERLGRLPEGFLAFGDAISSFDPVYGQGMSVAALEALALRRCLADGTDALPRRFFAAAARIIDGPWDISAGGDLRFPGVAGRRSAKVRMVNTYLERLHAAAERDPRVGRAFLRVVNLVDPPQALLHPRTAGRVLVAGRRPAAPGTTGAPKAAVPA